MICKPCGEAADSGRLSLHCKDKQCMCQHKPIKEGQIQRA